MAHNKKNIVKSAVKEDRAREEGKEDKLKEKIKQVKEACGDTQWTGARAVMLLVGFSLFMW